MANPAEIKKGWPAAKAAAFDRLWADFWKRAEELQAAAGPGGEGQTGAEVVLTVRFARGSFNEGLLDEGRSYS